jgi:CHAD domain-containing protein
VAAALHRTPAELIVGPVEARVQARFAKARASARRHVTAALGSQRYFRLLDELDRLLADPPLTPKAASPAADVLPVAVRSAYRRTRRRMRRASQAPAGQRRDEGLHEARKAAKRARYAAEAASAALGKPARRFAKRMKNVQSALGDYQDTVMARQAERDLGMSAHLAGENAFSYGLLYERDARDGERFQDEGLRAWRRASRPRYRRWLRQ